MTISRNFLLSVAAVIALLGISAPAQADLIGDLLSVTLDGNDCSGEFGQGFENCNIGNKWELDISPIILKLETGDPEINSAFPTISGDEFNVSADEFGEGTWSYIPGDGDPSVRFWVAKAGPEGFNLFWAVEDISDPGTAAACITLYSADCLNLATPQTMGSFSTPDGSGLSHISFYDGDGVTVPEPSTLLLLGTGLAAVGLRRRRRN